MIERHDRDWATWAGLAVVGAAAAVMSFTALADLARLLGVTAVLDWPWADRADPGGIPVAWLLPLTVDVLAAVATRVWLRQRTNAEALVYARRAAWAAIGATIIGNGAHGYLVSLGTDRPWGAAVAVSAVPALALGAMVHLAHLVGRGPDMPGEQPAPDPWLLLLDDVLGEPWDRAVGEWAKAVDGTGRRIPTSADPDRALAADLRAVGIARSRPLVQDEVRERYGVGAGRAARLRELAARPPGPAAVPAEASA